MKKLILVIWLISSSALSLALEKTGDKVKRNEQNCPNMVKDSYKFCTEQAQMTEQITGAGQCKWINPFKNSTSLASNRSHRKSHIQFDDNPSLGMCDGSIQCSLQNDFDAVLGDADPDDPNVTTVSCFKEGDECGEVTKICKGKIIAQLYDDCCREQKKPDPEDPATREQLQQQGGAAQ